MEELFNNIQARLAVELPELGGRIDEDYGQLEDEEGSYPLVYPLVLMSAPEANWQNMSAQKAFPQRGDGYITIRLALSCYDDTHYTSTTANKVADRLRFASRLNALLHGYRANSRYSDLMRTSSKMYAIGGAIKVYEFVYAFTVLDTGTS